MHRRSYVKRSLTSVNRFIRYNRIYINLGRNRHDNITSHSYRKQPLDTRLGAQHLMVTSPVIRSSSHLIN